jgi:sugar phosphate isomerase/epimerase
LKNTGPDVDAAALDAWVETTCRRAARVGVEMIVFGSGGSRRVPDGFSRERASEQIVENLQRYGPIAAAHGVTIVLEPLASQDCNIVTSVDEGAELVRAAGHRNVRLLIDTYHMAQDDDPIDSIRRAEGLIAHAHCAEGDGRGPLGTKGEDQGPYFRALKDIGYEGRISLECQWDDFAAQVGPGVAELRRQWDGA